MKKQSKFFVSLLKSVEKRLQPGKVSKKFVHSEYSHNFHQSNYFSSLPNYFIIFQFLKQHGDVKRQKCDKINEIHNFDEELPLDWTTDKSCNIFNGKNNDSDNIQSLDDKNDNWVSLFTIFINLKLFKRRNNKCDC